MDEATWTSFVYYMLRATSKRDNCDYAHNSALDCHVYPQMIAFIPNRNVPIATLRQLPIYSTTFTAQ